jgi:hypothetical protein
MVKNRQKGITKAYRNDKKDVNTRDTYDIRRLIASHVAHTFREKFARHMLPFNYAVGTPNGTNFIINTMQLEVEKYITLPQSRNTLPSRAGVFFDLPTSSTVYHAKLSSKSSQTPSQKYSPSLPSSTKNQEPSTTNGLMAHGAPYSWKKESAKAVHYHQFLPHS